MGTALVIPPTVSSDAAFLPDAKGKKRGGGRPSYLTPKAKSAILANLRLGLNQDDSAALAGVKPWTMTNWLKKGRRPGAPESSEYVQFAQAVDLAVLEGKRQLIGIVRAHAPRRPDIALKMLGRRWPKEWGPKAALEITQQVAETDAAAAARERVEAKLEAIRERQEQARKLIATMPGLKEIAGVFDGAESALEDIDDADRADEPLVESEDAAEPQTWKGDDDV